MNSFYNIPFSAAKCNGVQPWLLARLTFAPFSINNSTTALLPEESKAKNFTFTFSYIFDNSSVQNYLPPLTASNNGVSPILSAIFTFAPF